MMTDDMHTWKARWQDAVQQADNTNAERDRANARMAELEEKNQKLTEALLGARQALVDLQEPLDRIKERRDYLRDMALHAMWLGTVHEVGVDLLAHFGLDGDDGKGL